MLLTGQLGATVSAAQTVVFNTISLLFMIPLAISVAVTTRAGQALGAGDEVLAKLTSKLSLIMVAGVQSCIGLTLIALRHKWGYIFSNSGLSFIFMFLNFENEKNTGSVRMKSILWGRNKSKLESLFH